VPATVCNHGVVGADDLRHLLAAAIEGDDLAFGQLVRATQPAVWRVCRSLGSAGEEEDLVQETYLRAIRAAPAYRGDAPVLVWLLTIARRTCADHVRRRTRHRELLQRLAGERHLPATPGSSTEALLDELDDDRRAAFTLTQLVGLSYDEAAHVLDCPIGTVRSRVARARLQLLELVQRAEAR
jgi:RNA polymerase sigma-70 factor (ECF subfamily)